jgi:hypothetical protein
MPMRPMLLQHDTGINRSDKAGEEADGEGKRKEEEKRTATKMKSGSSTEENDTGILRPPAYRIWCVLTVQYQYCTGPVGNSPVRY